MQMHERLQKAWLAEGRYRTTHRTLTFTDQGLELGKGTLLVKFIQDQWDRRSLDIEGQEERILALLSVAWDTPMPDGILQHFHSASRALSKGEMVQACLHLAYTGLQPLDHDSDSFRLLFIADGFLEAGLTGNEIRKAWGLGRSKFRKDGHDVSGEARDDHGRWVEDGTSGADGENTKLDYIRQKIADALQNKKAIAIVGGAADSISRGAMKSLFRDFQNAHPGVQVEYFTHDEGSRLSAWLNEQSQLNGSSDAVAVVGHSYGGDTAASEVADGTKVGALITLDPVSRFPPNLKDVTKNAGTWINVNANSDNADGKDNGDTVAHWGGKWGRDPIGSATQHYNANIHHTGVRGLLLSP
jgi:hypothetical protein